MKQIDYAGEKFSELEPRDFFYRSLRKLVESTIKDDDIPELVNALMMLLTTWNKNYYRFFRDRKPGISFAEHFTELEDVLRQYYDDISDYRTRTLATLSDNEENKVREVFNDFSQVLGRVGAAKCLHLLAPYFFPLWDRKILLGYKLEHKPFRQSSDDARYWQFMKITREQISALGGWNAFEDNPLKALDEYNYCLFTKRVDFSHLA